MYMNPLITICIVNYNSSDFILNTLYCLKKITLNKYKVIIRDNNSQIKDFKNLKEGIIDYSYVQLYRVENFNYTGSLAHGIAINELIQKIDTKFGVILDADCTFLYKNWDVILINELNDDYPIIGTQASIGEESFKFDDFPLMFAILFDAKIMKNLSINFKPRNIEEFKDTGYELREKYLQKGYKGKLLRFNSTRIFKQGPFRKLIVSEFYFDNYQEIFASHFGRGSTLGSAKFNKGYKRYMYKFPILGPIILKSKGKREKKKWIKICQNLVS